MPVTLAEGHPVVRPHWAQKAPQHPTSPQKSFNCEEMTWKPLDYPKVKDCPSPPTNNHLVDDMPARSPSPLNSSDTTATTSHPLSTRGSPMTWPLPQVPVTPSKDPSSAPLPAPGSLSVF